MEFLRIVIEDMFAYRGRSVIELGSAEADRNIVIVSGRNGAGKTSLLNAVKLLFLGIHDDTVRRVSISRRERTLTAKQYVKGVKNTWYGVVNATAVADGVNKASVSIEWRQSGRSMNLSRIVTLVPEPDDDLQLEVDGIAASSEEAHAQLHGLMPREFVPFFFFDGEQIQELAEAEPGRETEDIERLLNLAFVGILNDALAAVVRERRRAELPEAVKVEMTRYENEERAAGVELEARESERIAIEDDLMRLHEDLRRTGNARDAMRGGISEADRRKLESRIEAVKMQRERLALEIATTLPSEAPFLTNAPLVERAFEALDGEARLASSAQSALIDKLEGELPALIESDLAAIDPPVPISSAQSASLRLAVGRRLRGYRHGHRRPDSVFHSMTPRQLQQLRDRYLVWRDEGASKAAGHAELLMRMRALRTEEKRAVEELAEAEVVGESARARYDRLGVEIAALHERVIERTEAKTRLEPDVRRLDERIRASRSAVERLKVEYETALRDTAEIALARKVMAVFAELREARRQAKRAAVEARLNEKVMSLLGTSRLIANARLDEHFTMSFFDVEGEPVARTSISSGMRQLTATSLLWALKEEAARPVPMMIDTPLGRLDRENRFLLAQYYYPTAGNPLVLLPTNSEFTSDILEVIAPHVIRSYRIDNPGGNNASLRLDEGRAAVTYG